MMKSFPSLRLLVALEILVPSAAGIVAACSGKLAVVESLDASSEDVTVDSTEHRDVITAETETTDGDAGAIHERDGDAGFAHDGDVDRPLTICNGFDASCCPIVGPADWQFSPGGRFCTGCVRTWCCNEINDCLKGDVDASVYNADGSMTTCNARMSCTFDCVFGGTPDASGCENACEAKFPTPVNAAYHAMMNCMLDGGPFNTDLTRNPGAPVGCALRYVDGSSGAVTPSCQL